MENIRVAQYVKKKKADLLIVQNQNINTRKMEAVNGPRKVFHVGKCAAEAMAVECPECQRIAAPFGAVDRFGFRNVLSVHSAKYCSDFDLQRLQIDPRLSISIQSIKIWKSYKFQS